MRRNFTQEEKAYIKELFEEYFKIDVDYQPPVSPYRSIFDPPVRSDWDSADTLKELLSNVYERKRDAWEDRYEYLDDVLQVAIILYDKGLIKKKSMGAILGEYLGDGYGLYLPCYIQDQIEFILRDKDVAKYYMRGYEGFLDSMKDEVMLHTVFPDVDLGRGGPAIFWTDGPSRSITWMERAYSDIAGRVMHGVRWKYFGYMQDELEKMKRHRVKTFKKEEILAYRNGLYIVTNHINYDD